MTRGPEDGHQGPSWVKQTPLSVEELCTPTATSVADVGADHLPTHPTATRHVRPFRVKAGHVEYSVHIFSVHDANTPFFAAFGESNG
jgi:hypothetical protein